MNSITTLIVSPNCFVGAGLILISLGLPASAITLLAPGDVVRAIDVVSAPGASNTPGGESAGHSTDAPNAGSKYLNFGGAGSGLIATPTAGSSNVSSLRLTTGNDAPERDPTSYQLYGTNSAIASAANSEGTAESWTLISTNNSFTLPAARGDSTTVFNFTNASSYTSYKVVFPTVVNSNLMQIADIELFTSASATGTNVISFGAPTSSTPVRAIDQPASGSSFASSEPPRDLVDGNPSNKYLNFGKENSGAIIAPASGLSIVDGIQLWTANDSPERDPASYILYGSNSSLLSIDNSLGDAEMWTIISTGSLSLPADRLTPSGILPIANSAAFSLYRIQFDTLKNSGAANSMQIGELQLYGTPVPEPSGLILISASALIGLHRRRRA